MSKTSFAFACLLAGAVCGAHAQNYWKWRDAGGQLHVSDSAPPADVADRNILQRPSGRTVAAAPAPASAPASAAGVDSELQKKKAQDEKDKADKAAASKAALDKMIAATQADNCQRAQMQSRALQSGVRVARLDASGERSYLDDKQRADELRRAQEIIAQNCN